MKPLNGPALVAMIALGLQGLSLLVAGLASVATLALMSSGGVDDRLLSLHDGLLTVLLVQGTIGYLMTAVAVIVWLWRAHANAEIIDGAAPEWNRKWVILGWIVPVLNLWVPRQIVADIWRTSAPSTGTGLINAWWALWLVFYIASQVVSRMGAVSMEALRTQTWAYVLITPLGIAAAAVAILVIRRITQAQAEQSERLARALAP
ncbi:DUF4328 domain-containing protein [Actinomadura sp. 9N407]|uniref:DUF4328 domain-containing protein n=1 Tax=Actinomadura sp. 9N407 TaxID=3375154 RepID=UPI0037B518C1